jgi:hypothetical protein
MREPGVRARHAPTSSCVHDGSASRVAAARSMLHAPSLHSCTTLLAAQFPVRIHPPAHGSGCGTGPTICAVPHAHPPGGCARHASHSLRHVTAGRRQTRGVLKRYSAGTHGVRTGVYSTNPSTPAPSPISAALPEKPAQTADPCADRRTSAAPRPMCRPSDQRRTQTHVQTAGPVPHPDPCADRRTSAAPRPMCRPSDQCRTQTHVQTIGPVPHPDPCADRREQCKHPTPCGWPRHMAPTCDFGGRRTLRFPPACPCAHAFVRPQAQSHKASAAPVAAVIARVGRHIW